MEREEQRGPRGGAAAGPAQAGRALPGWRGTAQTAQSVVGGCRVGPDPMLGHQLKRCKDFSLVFAIGLAIFTSVQVIKTEKAGKM